MLKQNRGHLGTGRTECGDELMQIAAHEFGHVLGICDMYPEDVEELAESLGISLPNALMKINRRNALDIDFAMMEISQRYLYNENVLYMHPWTGEDGVSLLKHYAK